MNRQSGSTRRDFLQAGVLSSVGAMLAWPELVGHALAADASDGVCVALCNHWSYIGIGWQLGIESNVLSVNDGMGMADLPPHVKTCINLDARAYEVIAEKFPEVAERLKKYLAEGKLELIGGTYAQPMGTMFSGESNIRQIVVGREVIRKTLNYDVVTFLEEEEFTHPQLPQILAGAGFPYASLAQVDTWGKAGIPLIEQNIIRWKGIDGTEITTIPKNSLFGSYSPNLNELSASPVMKTLKALGKPLIFTWEEFGWESPDHPDYIKTSERYKKLAEKVPVEFVTCKEYIEKYGKNPKESVYLPMDAWNKSLTWGLGGDQVRAFDRKVEALLLAAERFDAVVSTFGVPSQVELLEKAWRDLLTAQSHDVGLCEYSRWQLNKMPPPDRIEDRHNFTWGAIGFNHLDAAQRQGQTAFDAATGPLLDRIDSATTKHGARAITVLNPSGQDRTDLVTTGRIYPITEKAAGVVVRNRAGQVIPSQIIKAERDAQRNLVVADVAFLAKKTPSVGYDTYYLDFTPTAAREESALKIDESTLTMENESLKVRLDAASGGIVSLVDKRTGRESLAPDRGPFPAFCGKPNPHLPLMPDPPAMYDSRTSKAAITWEEKGPVRASVRARHVWKYLTFETQVNVTAGLPHVEVISRILSKIPPMADVDPNIIKEGYWFNLATAFEPTAVVRDFPLAIEPTKKVEFHALTFVDLVGKDQGLLLLHPGTQWFRRSETNVLSNLVMREWESYFMQEYGWPIYSEYRHVLMPHAGNLTNADRVKASVAFSQPLITRVGKCHAGTLPVSKSFVQATPDAVQLLALRKKPGSGMELRVVDAEGRKSAANVKFGFEIHNAYETNLLGEKTGEVDRDESHLRFDVDPWKIRTFKIA